MKKSILIICAVLTAFSLMAFGYIKWNGHNEASCNYKNTELDLFYNVDSRFIANVTKENLHNSKSIIDILPKKATLPIVSYQSSEVFILNEDNEISEKGESHILNDSQIALLQTTDYSNNILIKANFTTKNSLIGDLKNDYLTYYITIIPEKEAEFASGLAELLQYLRENSKEETSIIKEDKLQPGRVNFIVTKNGSISNVRLNSTCGYSSVDKALVEMIENMPEKWEPATNSKGDKVDQELIFFFGKAGC